MTNNISNIANSMINNKSKTIIWTVVAVLVIVIIILFIVKFSKLKDLIIDSNKNRDLAESLDGEISTSNITLTQAQFNAYASTLLDAMDGPGTNEEKVYLVFHAMNTRSDILQLIKTFGVKNGETLNEWLHDDFTTSEINKINQILAGNGINYAF